MMKSLKFSFLDIFSLTIFFCFIMFYIVLTSLRKVKYIEGSAIVMDYVTSLYNSFNQSALKIFKTILYNS